MRLGQPSKAEFFACDGGDHGIEQAPVRLVNPDPDLTDDNGGQTDRQVKDQFEDGSARNAAVDEQRKSESEQRRNENGGCHPDDGVDCRVEEQAVSYDFREIGEAHEIVVGVEAVPVGKAVVERAEKRPDDENREYAQRRGEQRDSPKSSVALQTLSACLYWRWSRPLSAA